MNDIVELEIVVSTDEHCTFLLFYIVHYKHIELANYL